MKKYIISTFFLGIFTFGLMAQSAPDSIKKVQLGNILIQDQPLDKTASSTSVNDKIQNLNQVKNVADLFKEINGFSLIKRSSYALDPVLRSFKYEQLNIQYDGGTKAMHACPNRMDPVTSFVIPEEVEQIEIIRGPFSVRYGPNFGGVVNMVTQRNSKTHKTGLHGNVLAGYESNGGSFTTNASLEYAKNNYDLIVNGSMRDYGNYTDGNNSEVPSSFKSYDYSIKSGYNVSNNQRIQLNWRQSFGRDVLHAGLPMDTKHDNSSILSMDYKWENISDKLYSFQAKAFYSYVDHLMSNDGRKNVKIVEATTPVEATTFGGKLELQLALNENHLLYLGTDLNTVQRSGNRTRVVKRNPKDPEIVFEIPKIFLDSIWQDASIIDFGVFGEGKYTLNHKVTLAYGVRFDFVNTKSENPVAEFKKLYTDFEDVNDLNISGHFSTNYYINDKINLQFALGRGVRSASMEEKYINHLAISKDPYEYVGNPLLKPEANHQVELSLNGKVSRFNYGTNLFYSYITDYIIAEVDSTIKRKYLAFKDPKVAKKFQNIDVVTQLGVEAFIEVSLINNLSMKGEVAYVKSHNQEWDEPLAQVSPLTSVLTLKYETKKIWSDIRAKFVSQQDQISQRFGEEVTPAYNVVDFRIGFKPTKNLTIAGSVLNVFDEYYYDHLNFSFINSTTESGKIFEQGRSINVFLRYDF